jgi:hypothetical protein
MSRDFNKTMNSESNHGRPQNTQVNTKPLATHISHGKHTTYKGSRVCLRCGTDISNRHGNAKYCISCTDKKSKPFVVSCRVNEETYKKMPNPHQQYLEGLIEKDLAEA